MSRGAVSSSRGGGGVATGGTGGSFVVTRVDFGARALAGALTDLVTDFGFGLAFVFPTRAP
jgi:hypothetical protein